MLIKRDSVKRAIELLEPNQKEKQTPDTESSRRVNCHCKIPQKTKQQPITSFSKNLVLTELRSQVARRNWSLSKSLFLLLLRRSVDIEPLIWRYAFIISLYGNSDSFSNITQFLETCVGTRQNETVLRNLLLLTEKGWKIMRSCI